MPRLADLQNHNLPNDPYGYSAVGLEKLGATEYTVVGLAQDVSGSVGPFKDPMEKCLQTIVEACKHSKRADNLLIRRADFDDAMHEIHGFRLLPEIKPDEYNGSIQIGGSTALFDTTKNMIESIADYGKRLADQEFAVNGILFVVTDGCDNVSKCGMIDCKNAFAAATQAENLESLVSVLIGVNISDATVKQHLEDFSKTAGFTQFVDMGAATKEKLARLADFVSKSISAQSQALGSGGPSKPLTF